MNESVKRVLDLFQQISALPRCSKKEKEIGLWLEQWGKTQGFTVKRDTASNLLITVPASSGFEKAPVIVIQGHMDMVCEKSPDSAHDFDKDPIRLIYDGDWLRADNTTLGADNGIALALSMALVTDPAVFHPPVELLFTVDEETGLNSTANIHLGHRTRNQHFSSAAMRSMNSLSTAKPRLWQSTPGWSALLSVQNMPTWT